MLLQCCSLQVFSAPNKKPQPYHDGLLGQGLCVLSRSLEHVPVSVGAAPCEDVSAQVRAELGESKDKHGTLRGSFDCKSCAKKQNVYQIQNLPHLLYMSERQNLALNAPDTAGVIVVRVSPYRFPRIPCTILVLCCTPYVRSEPAIVCPIMGVQDTAGDLWRHQVRSSYALYI